MQGIRALLRSDPEIVYRIDELLPKVEAHIQEKIKPFLALDRKVTEGGVAVTYEQYISYRNAEALCYGLVTYISGMGLPLSVATFITTFMLQDTIPLLLDSRIGHYKDIEVRLAVLKQIVARAFREQRDRKNKA
jgi:hypothetical protein